MDYQFYKEKQKCWKQNAFIDKNGETLRSYEEFMTAES